MNQYYLGKFRQFVFKISKVTPIYKSDSMSELGNYRPISVIPSFSKVLERLVYNQLMSFLEKECLLFNCQFGFRKGYSTGYAILKTLENLKSAIDDQKITCGIFLDFSKAFDTINHNILLTKLHKYGIRGLRHAWFSSYITNRKQYVKVGNAESSLKTIACGVPQGSTLGPLLFLLYINGLPSSSDKTNYMIIASPKKKTNISITTCCIEQKSQIKYLGVFIDEHLKWDAQLQHINNKLTKNVGILFKLRHYMPINALKQLYYTLIFPYLNYGLMSFDAFSLQTKEKILHHILHY